MSLGGFVQHVQSHCRTVQLASTVPTRAPRPSRVQQSAVNTAQRAQPKLRSVPLVRIVHQRSTLLNVRWVTIAKRDPIQVLTVLLASTAPTRHILSHAILVLEITARRGRRPRANAKTGTFAAPQTTALFALLECTARKIQLQEAFVTQGITARRQAHVSTALNKGCIAHLDRP